MRCGVRVRLQRKPQPPHLRRDDGREAVQQQARRDGRLLGLVVERVELRQPRPAAERAPLLEAAEQQQRGDGAAVVEPERAVRQRRGDRVLLQRARGLRAGGWAGRGEGAGRSCRRMRRHAAPCSSATQQCHAAVPCSSAAQPHALQCGRGAQSGAMPDLRKRKLLGNEFVQVLLGRLDQRRVVPKRGDRGGDRGDAARRVAAPGPAAAAERLGVVLDDKRRHGRPPRAPRGAGAGAPRPGGPRGARRAREVARARSRRRGKRAAQGASAGFPEWSAAPAGAMGAGQGGFRGGPGLMAPWRPKQAPRVAPQFRF
jgi:hypothetical protein